MFSGFLKKLFCMLPLAGFIVLGSAAGGLGVKASTIQGGYNHYEASIITSDQTTIDCSVTNMCWYMFTPKSNGLYTITVQGDNAWPMISLFTYNYVDGIGTKIKDGRESEPGSSDCTDDSGKIILHDQNSNGASSFSFTKTLNAGTTYLLFISDSVSSTDTLNISPNSLMTPVLDLKSSGVSPTSADFTWTKPVGAQKAEIQQSTDEKTWSSAAASAKTDTSATVTDLLPNTTYYFRLNVTGGDNAGYSNIAKALTAKEQSTPPYSGNISIVNNTGDSDTVTVKNPAVGDIITVYDAQSGGTSLGTKTSSGESVDVGVKLPVISGGKVYVTVTSTGKAESPRAEFEYAAECPSANEVTVTNNPVNEKDEISITGGLADNETVEVSGSEDFQQPLDSVKVASGQTAADIILPDNAQLTASGGTVYIRVTGPNGLHSLVLPIIYGKQNTVPLSTPDGLSWNGRTAKWNAVSNAGSYTVSLYKNSSDSQSDASKVDSFETPAAQYDLADAMPGFGAGYYFFTVKALPENQDLYSESPKSAMIDKSCNIVQSGKPDTKNVVVINNNGGKSDTVTVSGLADGDVVKVYGTLSGGTPLGIKSESNGSAEIAVDQLGAGGGTVYVTRTGAGQAESDRADVNFAPEIPVETQITVANNNVKTNDVVTLTGLFENEVVKVYADDGCQTILGSGTVQSDGTSVTVTLTGTQLSPAGGTVFVTVTGANGLTSAAGSKDYGAQAKIPLSAPTTLSWDGATAKWGSVEGAKSYIVSLYKSATDSADGASAAGQVDSTSNQCDLSNAMISSGAGYYFFTVQAVPKDSLSDSYCSSAQSDKVGSSCRITASKAPDASKQVSVLNNNGAQDTVTVTNLSAGDAVNVYDAQSGGELLGTAQASDGSAAVKINQLGAGGGTVYVAIISTGQAESDRTAVRFAPESPLASQITAANNDVNTHDTVTVTGLCTGETVTVYSDQSCADILGTGIVQSGDTSAVVTLTGTQLAAAGGTVYIKVTGANGLISGIGSAPYGVQEKLPMPFPTGLSWDGTTAKWNAVSNAKNYSLYIYKSAADSAASSSFAEVVSGITATAFDISNYMKSCGAGYYFFTVQALPADSIADSYCVSGQSPKSGNSYHMLASKAPDASSVKIESAFNGFKITVSGLCAGDTVKVYGDTGNFLCSASAVVSGGNWDAVLSVAQISGGIYVTVTSTGKAESDRTFVPYGSAPSPTKTDRVISSGSSSETGSGTSAKITSADTNASSYNNIIVNVGNISVSAPVSVFSGAVGSDSSNWLVLSQDTTAAGTQSAVTSTAAAQNMTPVETLDVDLTRYYSSGASEPVHQLSDKATVVIALTDTQIAEIERVPGAKLLYYNPATGTLTDMDAVFDLQKKTVTFKTSHFSTFVIAGVNKAPVNIGVSYSAHVQNIGWQDFVTDGKTAGTTGRRLRLEALKVKLTGDVPSGASVSYQVYVAGKGWMSAKDGNIAGTTGKSLRTESVRLTINGLAGYVIKYRVHVQKKGWEKDFHTVANGTALTSAAAAGIKGSSLRVEAIEIVIQKA